MRVESNKSGSNPTAEFIATRHNGKFIEILANTFMIKGAVNDRGFEQGYAIKNRKNEYVLIDVIDAATRDAVKGMVKDGYNIKAILITGNTASQDVYEDLATLSKDAGDAQIYVHPGNFNNDNFENKNLLQNDALLNSFNITVEDLPAIREGAAVIYCSLNEGMLFTGDSAKGSHYDSDLFTFTRDKLENNSDEFELVKYWQKFNRDFAYLFPRKGKPALEVDGVTKSNIINWISKANS